MRSSSSGMRRRAPVAVGRPSSYRPEYAERAFKLCLLGATDSDMADFFEVSLATLNTWKDRHPEFLESLKRGKAAADSDIADSLYRSGRGYSHQAVKIFMNDGVPVTVPYVEHYPPNPTSAIFWLKNRRPDLWRDQKRVELTADPQQLSDEQLADELARRGIVVDADYEVIDSGRSGDGAPGKSVGFLRPDLLRPRNG